LTLNELLKVRALEHPERVAYTFLTDGQGDDVSLTFGQLDMRARAIAARLEFLRPACERVLLLYPPGIDYIEAFFGCLYARAAAVPAYPPRLNQSLTRLQGIVSDAQATLVMTTRQLLSKVDSFAALVPALGTLRWLATDSVADELAGQWHEPRVNCDTLAFLQYTSGSTAIPKGVMVSHGNLLHNQQMIQAAFRQDEESVIVGWLPLYHDMGLIGNVLQPLYLGAQSILMSPVTFLRRPFRWLEAISRYRATTSGGPNFAYDLCVGKVNSEQRDLLDLSSWRVAFNGSEPIQAETLERFGEAFESCGFRREAFYPCYGMAEATLLISGGQQTEGPTITRFEKASLEKGLAKKALADSDVRSLVGCGNSHPSEKIVIAHPESGKQCGPGEIGEIWVSGPSVARGYWQNPEQTAQTFQAFLADTHEGPFLRTGDLGFICDDELFVTGRLKDLLIIRGLNHYPQDLELTAGASHPTLRAGAGAAFSIEVEGEERLVIVQEVERQRTFEPAILFQLIRECVAEVHEVEVYAICLLKAGSIPKTSSGKIQRHECRARFLAGAFEVIAEWCLDTSEAGPESVIQTPETVSMESVAAWLVELLANKLRVEPHEITVDQPITRYGLDSLGAIELMHGIEINFGVTLPMSSFLQSPSLSELAAQTMMQLASGANGARPVRRTVGGGLNECALSYGQRALYFLHQLEPESPAYNIANVMRLRGKLDVPTLRRCFEALMVRHGSLRTTFAVVQEEPVQHVHERMNVSFEVADSFTWNDARVQEYLVAESRRPFDLHQGPLFRAVLLSRSETEQILLVTVHHIVADLWSLATLLHELSLLYSAARLNRNATLPPLTLEYADYACWQRGLLDGPEADRQWSYWQNQLAGELPVLNLPVDHPRPPVQTHHGAAYAFRVNPLLTEKLRLLGRTHSATLYMTLMAAFQILLHRYSGQRDILISSPTSGRGWAELSGVVGYFVNLIVLRADFTRPQTFEQLLRDVRRTTLEALAHQDYPFPLLVERLQPVRDPSRAPLVQVLFAMQKTRMLAGEGVASLALGESGQRLQLGDLVLESMGLEQRVTQFELTLMMAEVDGGLSGSLQYNTDLFEASTIERMTTNFVTLLESIVAGPDRFLNDLTLLAAEERSLTLRKWNETSNPYPNQRGVHELFEDQAHLQPKATAVACLHGEMTYEELNSRSNQLARHLRSLGIAPEVRVGILMDRSPNLIVALLGILKAGGAYVPLDPAYPAERLAVMLEDAEARVLITQARFLDALSKYKGRTVCLDADWDAIAQQNDERLISGAHAGNLAYVIFTSGSTGTPRGVQITHGALLNLVHWHQRTYGVSSRDRATQLAGVGFDASVWEVWPYLTTGASLHLADEETRLSPEGLRDWLVDKKITISFLPTPLAEQTLSMDWPPQVAMRTMLTGGDRLSSYPPPSLPFELVNHYGPTEYTVVTSFARLKPDQGDQTQPPIGRPISNTTIYVLDVNLNPVPVGVAGELHVGGAGLARGYVNQPGLTAERFIPHPFSAEPGARLYRTGDLARYRPNGDLEFLGRVDHQVKIRGVRIELGEIEAVLCRHDGVREAVTVVIGDQANNKRIIAYFTPSSDVAPAVKELRSFISQHLPDYMVPSVFILMDELPLTANGKVDRRILPALADIPGIADEQAITPRTPTEEVLAGIWSEVLGAKDIDLNKTFFELGGHSLLATRVMSRVHEVFKVELPLQKLFAEPTVSRLAAAIDDAVLSEEGLNLPLLTSVSHDGQLPLSFAQQRLWFLNQFEPENPFYNVPAAVRIRGPLNESALEGSFNEVIRRHESLRTRFGGDEGRPFQVLLPEVDFKLAIESLETMTKEERDLQALKLAAEEARRPFDLSRETLLRARLLKLGEADHILLVTMHHIVSDGWSMRLLIDELAGSYDALSRGELPAAQDLPIQYADFAAWQRAALVGEILQTHLDYWNGQLRGSNFALDLPADRPRPANQTFRGATIDLKLASSIAGALRSLARSEGATLFMTLLAALNILLQRYTGQDDVIVGTPVAGRNQLELENLIGVFVNTLVLRTDTSGDPTFIELLRRVRDAALGAYVHQDLPFEKLVEELQPQRDTSRSPLFQVMLVLQADPTADLHLGNLDLKLMKVDTGTAKFDLTLSFTETTEGSLDGSLEYSTDLFDEITVARMLRHLQTLLEEVSKDASRRISELPMMGDEERREVLVTWNDTRADYDELCITDLFEQQTARTPHSVALVHGHERLTYGELNERANRLAHYLRGHGVKAETLVGVLMERSVAMVVSLLAVLKAGGAYVPLDPAYPQERLRFMLEDSRAALLLTQSEMAEALPAPGMRVVQLDKQWPEITRESADNLFEVAAPGNVAYVIYTSGSTGWPKGVAIEHRSATVLLQWAREVFSPESLKGVLAATSICFDLSIFELFVPLSCGGKIILIENALHLPSAAATGEITLINTVPSAINELCKAGAIPASVQTVNLAGEPLPKRLVDEIYQLERIKQVFNLYGPTEDTTYSTFVLTPKNSQAEITIGRPIANTQVYLLDKNMQVVPAGVTAELFLGGAGLARGYVGRPAGTAERFVPNPFAEREGARLYRTGDLARYLPNGELQFLGRADHQVKIRGFRIELGEVENVLRSHDSVAEVVAVVREDTPGDRRVVVYLTSKSEAGGCDPNQLRRYLKERLPDYMVPSHFVIMKALPLTTNGKIDRRALPAPDKTSISAKSSFAAPRTAEEKKLADIWCELLGVDTVSIKDNFFDLGGHSLLVTQLASRIRSGFGIELPLRTLFELTTIAELSTLLADAGQAAAHSSASVITPRNRDAYRMTLSALTPGVTDDVEKSIF
jgi:amino acid adenylation domain-containing protein